MELLVERRWPTAESTIGTLLVDGEVECLTLEDQVRPRDAPKVPGKTAIPAGRYEVRVTYSNRFKCALPLLLNVPNFEGIRIHAGNTAADTEGCILVGQERGLNTILRSRAALADLLPKIQAALREGYVFITLVDLAAETATNADRTTGET